MAETTPALRGPTRSSHPPMMAGAGPEEYEEDRVGPPQMEIFQSQVVVRIWSRTLMSFGQAVPIALDSGNQNTEKP